MHRCLLAVGTLVVLLAAGAAAQQGAPLGPGIGSSIAIYPAFRTDGWWFRVNTADTRATKITYRFDTIPRTTTVSDWWFHSGGRRPELSPAAGRTAADIALQLRAEPADARASVCVFFGNRGVGRVEFTGQANQQLNTAQRDERCTPAASN
jgi:hypothetical protein